MDLKILSLSQDVSFEDGSITNFLIMRTPSGQMIRAIVSDESAKLLVEGMVAGPAHVVDTPRVSAPQVHDREVDADGAVVFGGSPQEDGEEASSMWTPPVLESPVIAPPPAYGTDPESQARDYRQAKMKAKPNPMGVGNAKTISKDEYGYPVVRNSGGMDPGEVVGSVEGGEIDEDGVGSI
jgi:hypothetical protein